MVKTLERWRASMPEGFEFTLKAWQLITHESSSPTFRRLRRKLTEKETQDAGAFRLTPIVKEAWETTLACAKALQTAAISGCTAGCVGATRTRMANWKNSRP
jgi:uncharacterized protein YecE (DUF72 family)